MADCFITRRGYGSGGGSSITTVTPEKLGYVSDAILFFDGRYNSPFKHISNGSYWIDLVENILAQRNNINSGTDLINNDYYIKQTGVASSFKIPNNFNFDTFTIEVFIEIISDGGTEENDIFDNYKSAGFGIYTENNKLCASIHNNSNYSIIKTDYTLNTKYLITITYDGQVFSFYFNGILVNTAEVSNYKKTTKYPYLGSYNGNNCASGAYNYYRFGVYNRALTTTEIAQNYNKDVYRYVDGNTDNIN